MVFDIFIIYVFIINYIFVLSIVFIIFYKKIAKKRIKIAPDSPFLCNIKF